MLPSTIHPDSVPFLLVRSSEPPDSDRGEAGRGDEDFETPVARRSVNPRLPPPRTAVKGEDLPSVIVEEPPLPLRSVERAPIDIALREPMSSQPTLIRPRPAFVAKLVANEPSRTNAARRVLVAGIVALGVIGATFGAMRASELHGAVPRAISGILHR